MRRQKRQPRYEKGVVVVPLGPQGSKGSAYVLPADYDMLVALGLSSNWNLSPLGYVTAPCARAPGAHVLLARVLMDCGPGESVGYRDGNKLNLRRHNLKVNKKGYSLYRAREFLSNGRQTD